MNTVQTPEMQQSTEAQVFDIYRETHQATKALSQQTSLLWDQQTIEAAIERKLIRRQRKKHIKDISRIAIEGFEVGPDILEAHYSLGETELQLALRRDLEGVYRKFQTMHANLLLAGKSLSFTVVDFKPVNGVYGYFDHLTPKFLYPNIPRTISGEFVDGNERGIIAIKTDQSPMGHYAVLAMDFTTDPPMQNVNMTIINPKS